MKIEARLFLAGIAFYTIAAIVYGLWAREPAGTTALALTAGLALLILIRLGAVVWRWRSGRWAVLGVTR